MTSQVSFKIDTKLKEQAVRKAQRQGLPFATVLQFATQAYIKGSLKVKAASGPNLNPKIRNVLARELKEIKERKNLSPSFDNAKDAIDYLKNL